MLRDVSEVSDEHRELAEACSDYIAAADPDWTGYLPDWFSR